MSNTLRSLIGEYSQTEWFTLHSKALRMKEEKNKRVSMRNLLDGDIIWTNRLCAFSNAQQLRMDEIKWRICYGKLIVQY